VTAVILSLIPAVLAWAGVAYKLPAYWRNRRDPAVRAFWLSLLFLALALTALLPPLAKWIDDIAGIGNLSRLLGNCVVLIAAWAVQIFVFLNLDYRRDGARARIQLASWALVGVLVGMTGLFVLAPVHHEAADFWRRYGTAPFMLEYRILYLAYLGLAVINIVRHSWHYAGIADRPSLALGLRFVAIGGLLGGGYVAHEGLRAAALIVGLHSSVLESDTLTRVLIASSVALMVAGVTMPAWGPRFGIPAVYERLSEYRSYRQLYPLWKALYRANPEIALLRPRSALIDALMIRDLDFRLYRRVVEIRDGSLALRPYFDSRVIEQARELSRAAELPDDERQATIEATSIAAALQARMYDQPVRIGNSLTPPSLESHGGADVASEAEVLVRVARCYRGSPIVRAIVAETKGRASGRVAGSGTPAGRG
jgi:hypothetical protein